MKKCPICLKVKPNKQFKYGMLGVLESMVCNHCSNLMSIRLTAFVEFDKAICERFGLDYYNISDYEKKLRQQNIHRADLNFKLKKEVNKR